VKTKSVSGYRLHEPRLIGTEPVAQDVDAHRTTARLELADPIEKGK
jgi:hypothetical protein